MSTRNCVWRFLWVQKWCSKCSCILVMMVFYVVLAFFNIGVGCLVMSKHSRFSKQKNDSDKG